MNRPNKKEVVIPKAKRETKPFFDNAFKTQRKLQKAKDEARDSRDAFFGGFTLFDLDDENESEMFWNGIDILKEIITESVEMDQRRNKDKANITISPDDAIKRSTQELFRLQAASKSPVENYELMIRFWKTLRSLKCVTLNDALYEIVNDKGDDAYGDFLDVLPLAGKEITDRCRRGDLDNYDHLKRLIADYFNNTETPSMSSFYMKMMKDENYMLSGIRKGLEKFFKHYCRDVDSSCRG